MKTNEYIIIIMIGYHDNTVNVTYSSKASESRSSIKIFYSTGQLVAEQRNIRQGDNNEISITPTMNMLPGTYKCVAYFDNEVTSEKSFTVV